MGYAMVDSECCPKRKLGWGGFEKTQKRKRENKAKNPTKK